MTLKRFEVKRGRARILNRCRDFSNGVSESFAASNPHIERAAGIDRYSDDCSGGRLGGNEDKCVSMVFPATVAAKPLSEYAMDNLARAG